MTTEELILEKVRAGLTREQAIEVIQNQAAEDGKPDPFAPVEEKTAEESAPTSKKKGGK